MKLVTINKNDISRRNSNLSGKVVIKLQFGSKGFFKNLDINIFQSYPDIERFRASVGLEAISFNKDIFTYAKPGYYEIIVITATCSKF